MTRTSKKTSHPVGGSVKPRPPAGSSNWGGSDYALWEQRQEKAKRDGK